MFKKVKCLSLSMMFRVITMLLRGLIYNILMVKGSPPIFIGANVRIIGNRRLLRIGKYSKIENHCIIQTTSEHGIRIGGGCTIGEYSMIRPSSYYGGKKGYGFEMGERSALGVRAYIGCSGPLVIGSDVIIGPNVTMIAENHNFSNPSIKIKEQGVTNQGIEISNDVWIGCNVTILDGVRIGEHSVIAAGSVVTKSFPSNSLIAGVPARLIRKL
ncbi:acyltransferase [Grimontia hollisae]|uniref:acyltransferase n=1 Tax=Grimontia hollisae TaxID=673 RepID=UPI000E023980|nr:acyltransferase [Grimontia hollisae]STQ74767.1 Galactoside O-acetyltransferase [Grimontia hollisae]